MCDSHFGFSSWKFFKVDISGMRGSRLRQLEFISARLPFQANGAFVCRLIYLHFGLCFILTLPVTLLSIFKYGNIPMVSHLKCQVGWKIIYVCIQKYAVMFGSFQVARPLDEMQSVLPLVAVLLGPFLQVFFKVKGLGYCISYGQPFLRLVFYAGVSFLP